MIVGNGGEGRRPNWARWGRFIYPKGRCRDVDGMMSRVSGVALQEFEVARLGPAAALGENSGGRAGAGGCNDCCNYGNYGKHHWQPAIRSSLVSALLFEVKALGYVALQS